MHLLSCFSRVWTLIFVLSSCHPNNPRVTTTGSSLQGTSVSAASCGLFKGFVKKTSQEPVFSKETTLFGTEIEFPFNVNELRGSQFNSDERALGALYTQKILELCKACSSWWESRSCELKGDELSVGIQGKTLKIYIGIDPGVLEIKTQPMTYQETEAWAPVMDTLIFGAAKAIDTLLIDPERERNRWSGHVNVSWPGLQSATPDEIIKEGLPKTNASLLVNFFIDTQNHAELALGVLGGDTRNATPLVFGRQEDRTILYTTRERFHRGAHQQFRFLTNDLWQAYPRDVEHSYISPRYGKISPRYTLINTTHILGKRSWNGANGNRLELRGFFTPRKASDMLSNYRIVNARLDYLYKKYVKNDKIVPYDYQKYYSPEYKTSGLPSALSPVSAALVYTKYLTEAGLNPAQEARYLRDPLVKEAVLRIKKPSCRP